MVTWWPRRARSAATVSPAGPLPTTATRLPEGDASSGLGMSPWEASQSARNRSSRPMATGSYLRAITQTCSHWVSCGQTRPVIAGRASDSLMRLIAARKSPLAASSRNPTMSMCTGQPSMHVGRLHSRQRWASAMASSTVYP